MGEIMKLSINVKKINIVFLTTYSFLFAIFYSNMSYATDNIAHSDLIKNYLDTFYSNNCEIAYELLSNEESIKKDDYCEYVRKNTLFYPKQIAKKIELKNIQLEQEINGTYKIFSIEMTDLYGIWKDINNKLLERKNISTIDYKDEAKKEMTKCLNNVKCKNSFPLIKKNISLKLQNSDNSWKVFIDWNGIIINKIVESLYQNLVKTYAETKVDFCTETNKNRSNFHKLKQDTSKVRNTVKKYSKDDFKIEENYFNFQVLIRLMNKLLSDIDIMIEGKFSCEKI